MKYKVLKSIPEHQIDSEPQEFVSFITKDEEDIYTLVVLHFDYNDEDKWALVRVVIDNYGFDIYETVSEPKPGDFLLYAYMCDDPDFDDHTFKITYENGEIAGFELIYARDDPTLPEERRKEVTQ